MLSFRYPDNFPKAQTGYSLYLLEKDEPGRHVAQFKWDGWRRPIYFDSGKIDFYSKHDAQAKSMPPPTLVNELRSLDIKNGIAFDAEWMGPRCANILNGEHYFILFDLLYYRGKWMGDCPYADPKDKQSRYFLLRDIYMDLVAKHNPKFLRLEPIVEMGFMSMFEKSKTMPLTEGVVTKDRRGKLVGNMTDCGVNGSWMRVKWRQ